MEDEKTAYLEYFKKLLRKTYLVLRKSKTFPEDKIFEEFLKKRGATLRL